MWSRWTTVIEQVAGTIEQVVGIVEQVAGDGGAHEAEFGNGMEIG
jgi:hypothetical protein